MTLVLTTNVVGQARAEPVRLPNRRRRLSTVVARHRPQDGRRFIVSVHRRGDPAEIYLPSDRTVRLRADWSRTLVGPRDVVVLTCVPMGRGGLSIGLTIASIALIALAPYAAPALAGAALGLPGAAAGGLATAIQGGLVVGGVALGYAAQASRASGQKKDGPQSYGITGGGNVPKPGARKPLLYGRCWSSPPLSQQDYFAIDGDANVLKKRMTLGLGRFRIHNIRVGDALFWNEATGIQAPFNSQTGPEGAAIEVLYEQASAIMPGDIIPSPSVSGQEVPRPGGNPARTPWYRLAPQGVSVDAAQLNWTYPAIYRVSSSGRNTGAPAGVVFFGREIDPNTGEVIGPEFELWRSREADNAYIRTPLRRNAYFRLPKSGAYEVSAQNAYPEPAADLEVENRVVWDAMFGFEDDTRIRPQTTEVVLRMRAGKGLTVTAYSDITVEATRILPVWTGSAWVEQPTRKAVWAYCDLVRSAYGLAAVSGADADKALYYANLLTENDTFDGQLPEVASFWEAASEVLQPLRADPVKVGAIHSFVRDESRAEPRHVLTRRQIVRDSSSATFKTKVEGGDVIVEFDRDGDPKRPDEARFSYGPPSRTPKRYKVNGITDGKHALKHATWLAAVAVFRGAERKITTEWDGRLVFPGDHVLSDLWFLKGKHVYGVASRMGGTLHLDVAADVPREWGYGSIRTRAGREWGILRMRGVGPRALELHPDDLAVLESRSGLSLARVLASDTQDPTTVVLGDLVELQETYVSRSAIPSDADHVQIEMVADDARVWQLLDEPVIVPAPVNADALAEPLVPQISVLHAKCERIETGIEVVWGVSATRGARNYEAELSCDGGATQEPLSPFGPASSGRAPMRQADGPVTVRARAFGRTGLSGEWVSTTFTTVAPVVDGALTEIVRLPPIDYEGLATDVRSRIDYILDVEKEAQESAAAALARAEEVDDKADAIAVKADAIAVKAKQDADAALARGNEAFDRALAAAAVGDANTAAIVYESQQRLTGDTAIVSDLSAVVARVGTVEAGIVTERTARAEGDTAQATRLDAVIVRTGAAEANITSEQTARVSADGALSSRIDVVSASTASNTALIVEERQARVDSVSAEVRALNLLIARIDNDWNAAVLSEQTARVDSVSAEVRALNLLIARIDNDWNAAVLSEQTARVGADGALATRIDQVKATTDGNTASIVEERTARTSSIDANVAALNVLIARVNDDLYGMITSESSVRADADGVLSSRIDVVKAATDGNSALIVEERQARTTSIDANVRALNVLIAQVNDGLSASITDERTARATADGALSTRIDSVTARTASNEANITTTSEALANVNSAMVSRTNDLYARSDRGTAVGRFEMQAQSGPSGVSARIAALVAVTSYGQTRGAGWYVDLRDDGTSRFVVDADKFFITKNGSSVPGFSFDGQTLTIPALVVTYHALLPDAASDRHSPVAPQNIDVSGPSSDWKEVPGTSVSVNPDGKWSVTMSGTVVYSVTANGTNNSLQTTRLDFAVGVNGSPYTSNGFAGAGVTAGNGNNTVTSNSGIERSPAYMELYDPGNIQRFSLLYRLSGGNAGSGRINYAQLKLLVSKR